MGCQGRSEAILSYNHILDHLEQKQHQDNLFKFRAIIGHQTPLSHGDTNYKGSRYNVMAEWVIGEITEDPLSLTAADDPVTCAVYAMKDDLLCLYGWKWFRSIAQKQKKLTRAMNQTKIRQVIRSTYQFGFLIPRDYKHDIEWDEQNGNGEWEQLS